ncbi:multidrug resistance-associated ABC transporter protein [Favolaschia claudopus]|uniref:Multidrug resistance-associated ABC transporter protein n=1 Tax=Favolaschia claudopus TaxID=2862362 RepID=A0AAW0CED1_9AGAR
MDYYAQSVPQVSMGFMQWSAVTATQRVDSLLIPGAVAVISAAVLLVNLGIERFGGQSAKRHPGIGKGAILGFRILRLICCLVLLGLSFYPVTDESAAGKSNKTLSRNNFRVASPYLYASILSLFSISPERSGKRLVRHANIVLFATFCVYVYRDLLPLASFDGVPMDVDQGRFLWIKIAILAVAAVIVPLFTPGQYIPLDPLNPQTELSPEQTASIFSFAFYFFMDEIVYKANRNAQLEEDQLYPLCDTDESLVLKEKSFKYLDKFSGSKSKRHITFGLLRVFGREYSLLAVMLVIEVTSRMASPYAMGHLLEYIETRNQTEGVRPWVWILLIFIAPVALSLLFHLRIYINVRKHLHSTILRQLMPSSLRIRMKPETSETKEIEPSTPSDATSTQETVAEEGSQEGESAAQSEDESVTARASSASVKSTTSKATQGKDKEAAKAEGKKSQGSLVGKINNLVTTDLQIIVDGREFLQLFVAVPLQTALSIWYLYVWLGWSVWVGLASILIFMPLPGYMAKLFQSVQKERMKRTDERVQSVTEAVNVLRMVKLFGWEKKMEERIGEKRTAELTLIRKGRLIHMVMTMIIAMTLTYATLVMKKALNASTVFATMTVFDILRLMTGWLNNLMTTKVSLDRLNDFLKNTELLDAYEDSEAGRSLVATEAATPSDERIGFRNAAFTWAKESDGSATRSQRQYVLKVDGELLFERGKISLIVGPTGSGKTSLLMALLGEMHWVPPSPYSWYNLPRGSGVAYAAQESWVLNSTIRDNILFDSPYDEERYKKVLDQCALQQDLKLFQAGDLQEVGERGLTLSGGQKARLTLARAVYSNASILLLDDVLAALDVHTATYIVDQLFSGDLIENRTVLLVTHNVALAYPIAHFVVTVGSDGKITGQGDVSEMSKHGTLARQIRKDQQILEKSQQEIDPSESQDANESAVKPADGKLILAEEVQVGRISTRALKMYLSEMGGSYPLVFFLLFSFGLFFQEASNAFRTWMLGYWAKQYEDRPAEQVNIVLNVTYLCIIAVLFMISVALTYVYYLAGQLRASKAIHQHLLNSVLRAPLRWLDVTPQSRILVRVTNDVRGVDDAIPSEFSPLCTLIVSLVVRFVAIVLYAPLFFIPGVLVGALGTHCGQIYMRAQMPVKRLMSVARAPVLAHFGAAIAGLVSIRAFNAESKFVADFRPRINRYTRAARSYYNLNRWVSVRVDILGATFTFLLTLYIVYIKPIGAGDTGFVINMAISFTSMLLWTVRFYNDFERIQGYLDIEHEKAPTESGKPPAHWPASGELRVENLSASYSADGPKVLRDISFTIKAGERVGIVGRTGSGKSSLTLSLLRCIPTEGSVHYDGIETSNLNLDALRSSITIIPQQPELLSGSLRNNLDPFGQYDDLELNYALRAAGLNALQDEMEEGRITLDTAISSGGGNLSVGQRQIFALARSVEYSPPNLLQTHNFETATSAIDAIIQNSLRQEMRGDVSVLTVAHRLQSIMDSDKIMVLDAGRIVELGSPKQLLSIKGGKLRSLVDESGDKDALYAMAGAS